MRLVIVNVGISILNIIVRLIRYDKEKKLG